MMRIDVHKLLKMLTFNEQDPLLFNSAFFLIFFGFFLTAYLLFQKTKNARIYFLTLFSLYFFYKTCGWYVGFILLAAVVDFNISKIIYETTSKHARKVLMTMSILLNVGLLFYFKYTNFFIDIINDVSQQQLHPLKLILPVGISFYTFENVSYTVDVYKREIKPVDKFIDYLFFLSFFPKLMMGPIVRAADFLPQIEKKPFVTDEQLGQGLYLITAGIIKKVVISDYINANYVMYIFDNPSAHTGLECLLAVYAYAMVIYCDFSGYSDMARGMAKWIGFEINLNFLSPYQSSSITEFWRRWHISLSSWLRDYIYIPLGGNRGGYFNTYRNLFITMIIGGFWHGASWNFIFWGALHGSALALHKLQKDYEQKPLLVIPYSPKTTKIINRILVDLPVFTVPYSPALTKMLKVMATFHFVCLGWIFFRCDSFADSWTFINQIFSHFNIAILPQLVANYANVIIMLWLGFLLHSITTPTELEYQKFLTKLSTPLKIVYLFAAIYLAIQFKQADVIKPIYLQF